MTSTNKWPYDTKQRLLRTEPYSLFCVRNEIMDIKKDYISIDNENTCRKKIQLQYKELYEDHAFRNWTYNDL